MGRNCIIAILIICLSSCEKSQDINDNILKFYGDALEDIGYSIVKFDDGYFIGGQLTEVARAGGIIENQNSIKNMGIIKTGEDGNEIWKMSFGNSETAVGSKIIVLDDGSVVCIGSIIDAMSHQSNIFVAKVNSAGTDSVTKIYKSTGNQYGYDIIKTPEGFLILGSTDVAREPLTDATGNATGKKDVLLLRISEALEQVISPVAIGYIGNDEGKVLKADINGGYIVLGTTDRSDQVTSVQDKSNIFLFRVNSDGSTTQPRIIGGIKDEYAADMEVLKDGYLIAGTIGSEGSVQKGYVWGISTNIYSEPLFEGNIDIDPGLDTKSSFSVNAISTYKTNSFVMAGQVLEGSSTRMLVFVTDSQGNFISGKKMISNSTGVQVSYDVISDDDANIIAVGKNSYENNSMISLLKFRF